MDLPAPILPPLAPLAPLAPFPATYVETKAAVRGGLGRGGGRAGGLPLRKVGRIFFNFELPYSGLYILLIALNSGLAFSIGYISILADIDLFLFRNFFL